MPKLTIEGREPVHVPDGKRLVLAIEDAGVDILHRCGGHARCTTCRVVFTSGEPERMTRAERDKLAEQGKLGEFRLSCQCQVTHDMAVRPLLRLSESELPDAGQRPEDEITPEADWVEPGQGSW